MICDFRVLIRLSVGTALGGAIILWSGEMPLNSQQGLTSSAQARIGRPLTPMSYAGVARRTTRRAVTYGAAAGAAAAGAAAAGAAAASRCVQAVDPYGRIYTRCY
jgi:hypothetical protein